MKRPYPADSAFSQNRTNYPQTPAILHNPQDRPNNVAPQAYLTQMRQQPAHNPFTHHTDLPYFEQALNTAEVNQYALPAEMSGDFNSTIAMAMPRANSNPPLLPAPEKHTEPLLIILDPQNPPACLPWPWIADVVPKIESYIDDDKQAGAWLATCKRNYFANSAIREFRVFQKIRKELKEYQKELLGDFMGYSQIEREFLIAQRFYEKIIPSKNNFLTSPLTKEVHDALVLDLLTDKLCSSEGKKFLKNTLNESEFLNGLRGLVRWHSAKFPPPVIHQIEEENNIDKIENYNIKKMDYPSLLYLLPESINNSEYRIKAFETLIKAFLWGCSINELLLYGDGGAKDFSRHFINEKYNLSISAIYRLGILSRSYQIIDSRNPNRLDEVVGELEEEGLTLFDEILFESEEALNYLKDLY